LKDWSDRDGQTNKKSEALSFAFCAAEEIRTLTAFRPLPPQSSASTSFATAAFGNRSSDFGRQMIETGGKFTNYDFRLKIFFIEFPGNDPALYN
jgi:hypothetical protein